MIEFGHTQSHVGKLIILLERNTTVDNHNLFY